MTPTLTPSEMHEPNGPMISSMNSPMTDPRIAMHHTVPPVPYGPGSVPNGVPNPNVSNVIMPSCSISIPSALSTVSVPFDSVNSTYQTSAPSTSYPSYSSGGGGGATSSSRYHPYSSSRSSHHSSSTAPRTSYGGSSSYSQPAVYGSSSGGGSSRGYGGSHSGGSSSSRYGSSSGGGYGGSSSSRYGSSSGGGDRYGSSGGSSRGGGGGYGGSSGSRGGGYGGDRGGGRSGGGRGKAPRNEFGIPYGQPGAALTKPDWSRMDLPKFQKNFYREAASIVALTDPEVTRWRTEHDIVVMGHSVPRPIRTFLEAGFPAYILAEIERAGFTAPTAIQAQGWPMAMSGRDVIGVAETGSGKTLAFLLPCIVHINAQPLLRSGDGPIVLVIAPTRELAMQIEGEVSKFAYSSKIKHCCVYGGVPRRDQANRLREGVEIIICTPGRMLDFLESGTTNLRRVTYLVIDEADRLLDMGFEPQLSSMLSQVRPDRQILMWSATWPKEVQSLSQKYFLSNDVIQVSVGSALSNIKANHRVDQSVECLEGGSYEKENRLYAILRDDRYYGAKALAKVLVFAATKKQCDFLHKMLRNDGYRCTVIHGDKQQFERDEALSSFKDGRNTIMIATDVASRGIHVNDISLVLNFDMPQNIEDYVHRIGRTARCGKTGKAISFFTRSDAKRANKLISILKEANQVVPPKLEEWARMAPSGGSGYSRYSSGGRSGGGGYGGSSGGGYGGSSGGYGGGAITYGR